MKDTNDSLAGGGRCAACDKILEADEVFWLPARKQFESLCSICRQAVREALREMPVDSWEMEK